MCSIEGKLLAILAILVADDEAWVHTVIIDTTIYLYIYIYCICQI